MSIAKIPLADLATRINGGYDAKNAPDDVRDVVKKADGEKLLRGGDRGG